MKKNTINLDSQNLSSMLVRQTKQSIHLDERQENIVSLSFPCGAL